MVARTDIPFMMETIPHLVRTSHYPFVEKVLFLDTAPLTGDKVGRPGIGTLEQLRENCARLMDMGVVDRLIDMDYNDAYRQQVYKKHFGSVPKPTHNWKGYPILGTIFSLEETVGDYVVHFDSDMLQYQNDKPQLDHGRNGSSWKSVQMCCLCDLYRDHLEPMVSLHQRVPYEQDDGFLPF